MNRYAAAGVLADVRAGKRVLVVCGSNTMARVAFWAVTDQGLTPDEKCYRTTGREKITAPGGGWARFRSVHSLELRGVTADVVLLDTVATDEELSQLKACVASTGGEVLRA